MEKKQQKEEVARNSYVFCRIVNKPAEGKSQVSGELKLVVKDDPFQ